jgi:hypothetical protein
MSLVEELLAAYEKHYPAQVIEIPRPVEDWPSMQLARIEANQAAIIEGLNKIGRHLLMDWHPIGKTDIAEQRQLNG